MTTAVKIDNVSIVFGDHPDQALPLMDEGENRAQIQEKTGQVLGVHNCSIDVKEGEILVLMGLSGSGKSTLLRAINGLNPVVRGAVHVHDGGAMVDVTHANAEELRRIRLNRVAMVFQQFGLLPWRSVRENVGLGLELGGMSKADRAAKVDEQLGLVGLDGWGDRDPAETDQTELGLLMAGITEKPDRPLIDAVDAKLDAKEAREAKQHG